GVDPAWQKTKGSGVLKSPTLEWNGLTGANPPDPSGAVGPNHYMQMVNSQYRVFDKTGTILKTGSLGSLLGGGNAGDPIVLYDKFADRWFISQFDFSNNLQVAVSQTGDPTGAYNSYTFNVGASFPDYPKYSVWSDGYYVTSNKSGNEAFVMERDKMIAGDAGAQMIQFNVPSLSTAGFFSTLPAHAGSTLPSVGTPNQIFYFQDNSWGGVGSDHIKVWDVSVDWTTTSNSTISSPYQIAVSAFDSGFSGGWDNITQPGTSVKLDAVPEAFMFMANYREFSTHNSMVMCHSVDVDNTNHAGIRWYELRQTSGSAWTLYQEGTYAPDGDSRWLGSINMDKYGNIALAYCVSGTNTYPSLRYTGRYASGQLGQMDFVEQTAIEGSSSKSGDNRWGDYAQMTIDPSDDATFWHTGPYVYLGGALRTRIFALTFPDSFLSIADAYMSKTLVVGYLGNNIFNLKIGDLNEGVNINVVNTLGQNIKAVNNINTGKDLNYQLDLSEFSAGYYIINVSNSNFKKAHKVWVK
ncbi:MAG: T9SS type A sorting domain-containing protein, partial [Halobacteriovoraceae bacterium]|nr:T9SS type A sorting domain-containing protein [Halobacteriovoraceae bacterium]